MLRMSDYGMLSPTQDICTSSTPKIQETLQKIRRPIWGARGQERLLWNNVSWTLKGHCMREPSIGVVASIRPARRSSQSTLQHREGRGSWDPSWEAIAMREKEGISSSSAVHAPVMCATHTCIWAVLRRYGGSRRKTKRSWRKKKRRNNNKIRRIDVI